MSITTEAAERWAVACDFRDLPSIATAIRSLAAERDALRAERDKAQGYLSGCLQSLYPNIEPLPDLLGICTQIDNALAGQQAENARLREVLKDIKAGPSVDHVMREEWEIGCMCLMEKASEALGEKE